MSRKLNEHENHFLSILHDHGAVKPDGVKQSLAATWLLRNGYVIDYGSGIYSIQPKGLRWLNNH